MCARPDPYEKYRDLSRLVEELGRVSGDPAPLADLGCIGTRLLYGLTESV